MPPSKHFYDGPVQDKCRQQSRFCVGYQCGARYPLAGGGIPWPYAGILHAGLKVVRSRQPLCAGFKVGAWFYADLPLYRCSDDNVLVWTLCSMYTGDFGPSTMQSLLMILFGNGNSTKLIIF